MVDRDVCEILRSHIQWKVAISAFQSLGLGFGFRYMSGIVFHIAERR